MEPLIAACAPKFGDYQWYGLFCFVLFFVVFLFHSRTIISSNRIPLVLPEEIFIDLNSYIYVYLFDCLVRVGFLLFLQ